MPKVLLISSFHSNWVLHLEALSEVQTLSIRQVRAVCLTAQITFLCRNKESSKESRVQGDQVQILSWQVLHIQLFSLETVVGFFALLIMFCYESIQFLLPLKMIDNKSKLGNISRTPVHLTIRCGPWSATFFPSVLLFTRISADEHHHQGGFLPTEYRGLVCPGQVFWPSDHSVSKAVLILSTTVH